MRVLGPALFILAGLFSSLTAEAAGPSPQLTYQGKLTNLSGTAPQTGDVTIRFEIFNPAGDCLLFAEDQSVNLDSPPGLFSVVIGSGALASEDPGIGLSTTFKTSGVVRSPTSGCSSGYTSASTDNRRLRITVTPLSTGVAAVLSPDQVLTNVPQAVAAISAETATTATNLQGLTPATLETQFQTDFDSRYLGIGANATSATTALSAGNFTGNLGGDVNGLQGSTTVVSIRGVPIATAAPLAGQVLQYIGGQWTATTPAVGASGTVTNVSGTAPITVSNGSTTPAISMTTASSGSPGYITASDYLNFSGKVSKAGDTMTGALIVPTLTVGGALAFSGGTPGAGKVLTSDAAGNATWNTPAMGVTNVSIATGPLSVANGSSTPAISMTAASSGSSGYITASDYLNFTSKMNSSGGTMTGPLNVPTLTVGALAVTGGTPGAGMVLTSDAAGNATWNTPPGGVTTVSGSGVVNVTGTTAPVVSIPAATGSTSGYLSSTDYTTFSNKVSKAGDTMTGALTVPTLTVGGALAFSGGTPGAGKVLTSDAAGNATWNSPALGVTTVSGSGVVNVINGSTTPSITISAANGSTSGYLSSTDYTTFSNKVNKSGDTMSGTLSLPSLTVTGGTPAVGKVLTSDASGNATWGAPAMGVTAVSSGTGPLSIINGSTTPVISIPAATTSVDGYLSSTDFANFSGKVSKAGDTMSGALTVPNLTATTSISTNALTVTDGTQATGKVLTSNASGNATWSALPLGGVSAVAPLSSTGGATPALSIATATTSQTGALSSTDFTSFQNAQTTVAAATNTSTASTLVKRDPSGGIAVGALTASTITSSGAITGNIDTANITSGTLPVIRGGTGVSTLTSNAAIVANGTGTGMTSVAPGTVGNVLVSNGTQFTSGPVPLQPIMHGMQVFSTSGSFPLPAGITKLYVKVWGGGGGGSGVGNGAGGCSGTVYWYGGSGAGYVEGLIDPAPATLTVTVGTGGTAGVGASAVCGNGTQTSDTNKGGDGTASSLTGTGVTITANGGKGAGCNQTFNSAPYAGGTGSGSGSSFTQFFAVTGGTSLDQSGGGTFAFGGASYGGSPSGFGAAGAGGRQCAGNGSAGAPGAVIVTW